MGKLLKYPVLFPLLFKKKAEGFSLFSFFALLSS